MFKSQKRPVLCAVYREIYVQKQQFLFSSEKVLFNDMTLTVLFIFILRHGWGNSMSQRVYAYCHFGNNGVSVAPVNGLRLSLSFFEDIKENLLWYKFDVSATQPISGMKHRWTKTFQGSQYPHFGRKCFLKLTRAEKVQHTMRNCCRCVALSKWHKAFPLKSKAIRTFMRPTRRASV